MNDFTFNLAISSLLFPQISFPSYLSFLPLSSSFSELPLLSSLLSLIIPLLLLVCVGTILYSVFLTFLFAYAVFLSFCFQESRKVILFVVLLHKYTYCSPYFIDHRFYALIISVNSWLLFLFHIVKYIYLFTINLQVASFCKLLGFSLSPGMLITPNNSTWCRSLSFIF